jgi:hypothetical protein
MDETIWLTQKSMGELFGVESHTITYHLKALDAEDVMKYIDNHYNSINLNIILSKDTSFSKYPSLIKSVNIIDYFSILVISFTYFLSLLIFYL